MTDQRQPDGRLAGTGPVYLARRAYTLRDTDGDREPWNGAITNMGAARVVMPVLTLYKDDSDSSGRLRVDRATLSRVEYIEPRRKKHICALQYGSLVLPASSNSVSRQIAAKGVNHSRPETLLLRLLAAC